MNALKKNKYTLLAIGLYANYGVHGMGTVILSQNKTFLAEKWNTDTQTVLMVISALGIGRLLSMAFSGILSDKFGRRPLVMVGILSYILFFGGILMAPNASWGFIFAMVGGFANAFLDTGTYPALIDAFPERSGFASMIVGFAVSWGQFLYPLILALVVSLNQTASISFIIPLLLLGINIVFLRKKVFPRVNECDEVEQSIETSIKQKKRGRFSDYLLFPAYSFFCQATSYIVITWMADFSVEIANVSLASSSLIVSLYGAGAILCVPLTYKLNSFGKNDSWIQLFYTLVSFVAVIFLLLFPSPIMCAIFAMLIGISTEGGVMQLVLSLMTYLFPEKKGYCTGLYYSFSGAATFIIPIFSGYLARNGVVTVMWADLAFAFIALVLSIMIHRRYTTVTKEVKRELEAKKNRELMLTSTH